MVDRIAGHSHRVGPGSSNVTRPLAWNASKDRGSAKTVKTAKTEQQKEGKLLDKVLFSVAELLGMALSSRDDAAPAADVPEATTTSASIVADDDVTRAIVNLYSSSYFFCGTGRDEDWGVFAPDCVFSDEFSSFKGTERFRRNVTNFGKALQSTPERVCRLTKLQRGEDARGRQTITAGWIFRSRVIWVKGLLAASGTTTYVVDERGRIIEHNERWATSKADVFRRLLFGG